MILQFSIITITSQRQTQSEVSPQVAAQHIDRQFFPPWRHLLESRIQKNTHEDLSHAFLAFGQAGHRVQISRGRRLRIDGRAEQSSGLRPEPQRDVPRARLPPEHSRTGGARERMGGSLVSSGGCTEVRTQGADDRRCSQFLLHREHHEGGRGHGPLQDECPSPSSLRRRRMEAGNTGIA